MLPALVAELRAATVSFHERLFQTAEDVRALPQNIVINCTGYGAGQLFGDDNLVPQRGHLVVLERTQEAQSYFFSGGCSNPVISYVFCRQNDIVLGGTIQTGQDATTLAPNDEAVFARILGNASVLFGGHPAKCTQ